MKAGRLQSIALLILYTVTGLLAGVALGFMAFLAAGIGHGCYLPAFVFSFPCWYFGVMAALFGAPVFWGIVGLLLSLERHRMARFFLLGLMAVHYGGAIWIFRIGRRPYGPDVFNRWEAMRNEIVLGFVIYVSIQLSIWTVFVMQDVRRVSSGEYVFQFSLARLFLIVSSLCVALAFWSIDWEPTDLVSFGFLGAAVVVIYSCLRRAPSTARGT